MNPISKPGLNSLWPVCYLRIFITLPVAFPHPSPRGAVLQNRRSKSFFYFIYAFVFYKNELISLSGVLPHFSPSLSDLASRNAICTIKFEFQRNGDHCFNLSMSAESVRNLPLWSIFSMKMCFSVKVHLELINESQVSRRHSALVFSGLQLACICPGAS